jgi:hypothetical protein
LAVLERGGDPAEAGVGLHWYAPAMPADGPLVSRLVADLEAASDGPLLLTLTSVHATVMEATVPLMFDPTTAGATERARERWIRLLRVGLRHEVAPYRVSPRLGAELVRAAPRSAARIESVARALDPRGRFVPRIDWARAPLQAVAP